MKVYGAPITEWILSSCRLTRTDVKKTRLNSLGAWRACCWNSSPTADVKSWEKICETSRNSCPRQISSTIVSCSSFYSRLPSDFGFPWVFVFSISLVQSSDETWQLRRGSVTVGVGLVDRAVIGDK